MNLDIHNAKNLAWMYYKQVEQERCVECMGEIDEEWAADLGYCADLVDFYHKRGWVV